jgi:hypothetical protein
MSFASFGELRLDEFSASLLEVALRLEVTRLDFDLKASRDAFDQDAWAYAKVQRSAILDVLNEMRMLRDGREALSREGRLALEDQIARWKPKVPRSPANAEVRAAAVKKQRREFRAALGLPEA